MPLEATHLRFALDLQTQYCIKDIRKYLSGAIYPDSRYATGLDKTITHDDKFLLPEFADTDFKKGWQTHQICDLTYDNVRKKLFPDIFPVDYASYNESEWIKFTAMKIIQDMDDIHFFDLQSSLNCLDYADNPNGEAISEIKRYNQIIIDLYRDKKVITLTEHVKMWLLLKPGISLGKKIQDKAEEFLNNPEMVRRIKAIYQEMMASYSEIVRHRLLDKF